MPLRKSNVCAVQSSLHNHGSAGKVLRQLSVSYQCWLLGCTTRCLLWKYGHKCRMAFHLSMCPEPRCAHFLSFSWQCREGRKMAQLCLSSSLETAVSVCPLPWTERLSEDRSFLVPFSPQGMQPTYTYELLPGCGSAENAFCSPTWVI